MESLLLLLCVIGALCGEIRAADPRPNVILIYTDDHGYSDLGIHGLQSDLKTPHLDALARSGVVAKNGYSTAPQCVPSRGGLLTGRFQGRFNLDNNGSALDGFNQQTTLAERLGEAVRDVTKLRGAIELLAPGSLPNDGKVIEDARSYK